MVKTECIRAYNCSIFQLRQNYRTVFPEKQFQPIDMFDHKHGEDAEDT